MISLNAFSRIVKIGAAGLIAISAILFLLGFIIGETEVMSEILEKAGIMAEIAAIAAFALWVIRVLLMQLKKRKFNYLKWVQLAFKLLKAHHTLIGSAAFAAGLAHGSYFFLQTNEETGSIYSGLATLIGFAILVLLGLLLNKWGKGKKYLKYKRFHQGSAIVFGITLAIHLLFG